MRASPGNDDERYRACVRALWTLVEVLRDGSEAQVEAALARALEAVNVARGRDNYLLLHEVDGALHLSGRRMPIGVDMFLPAQGLVSLLREHDIGEVLFDQSVDHEAIRQWARGWGNAAPAAAVDPASHGADAVVAADPPVRPQTAASGAAGADSQLRSTFLQHQLIAAFTSGCVIPPHIGKVTLAAVVDRLLMLDGGTEPLTLLHRGESLLQRSLHVAVFGVVFARALGWPEGQLADFGSAALLHDIGCVIDPARPAIAAFRWLLERGRDRFWLQAALVARTWRDDHGSRFADLGPESNMAAAIVRVATEVERAVAAGSTIDGIAGELAAAGERGAFPREMAGIAAATVGQMLLPA
ncbi:MAG: hypothetical protein KDC98_26705 [Planctomycetes bacterium]|nr:hypothetical protein [Planctomycetota bacterium]